MNSAFSTRPYIKAVYVIAALAVSGTSIAQEKGAVTFTDQPFQLPLTITQRQSETGRVPFTVKTVTRNGWGPTQSGTANLSGDAVSIKPLCEGIHIVELQTSPPINTRFLAITPPAVLDKGQRKVLLRSLPHSGRKLLSGQPFNLLAMGDSVTATGDYPLFLAKLLERATGNSQIRVIKRAYPGRSIDATVREWPNDGPPNKPDWGLLMYGLNDQIVQLPLSAYLEQYEWVQKQLTQLKADTVFLQPTPHIDIPVSESQRKADSNPPSFAIRTAGYAAALAPVANKLGVPLSPTFGAIWGNGGTSIEDAARRMWPLYPTSFDRQMESLLESGGQGDTIHPNALGHLQIARTIFETLTGTAKPSVWKLKAQSRWTSQGVETQITARNASNFRRQGRLEAVPPTDAQLQTAPVHYDLAPNQEIRFTVRWPQARKPEDLLRYPNDIYLAQKPPMLQLIDFNGRGSQVYVVTSPFEVQATFRRERWNGVQGKIPVTLSNKTVNQKIEVTIPTGVEVGRIPLIKRVQEAKKTGWAAAELGFVRYGVARSGEAVVDGDLAEWPDAVWSTVGETVQARWVHGAEENRVSPDECFLKWAFKAGEKGVFVACRATGTLDKDYFTLFFDPRSPKELGTIGRYYWVSGKLIQGGRVELNKGETSTSSDGLQGVWKKTSTGAAIEMFVPYQLMDTGAWPASGDLGLSIDWMHTGPTGKITHLQWSENGHPWNPRWYGVVRRTDQQNPSLPYMVRVH